jgi:hypothetical protein
MHVVHAPSNPIGWTAGKWMEWYPDVLNADGKLTTKEPKPYWQAGWLKQHDRLVAAMTAMKGRIPITVVRASSGRTSLTITANPADLRRRSSGRIRPWSGVTGRYGALRLFLGETQAAGA